MWHTKVEQVGWEWSQAVFVDNWSFSHWLDHAGSIAIQVILLPYRKKAGEYQELQNRKVLAIAVELVWGKGSTIFDNISSYPVIAASLLHQDRNGGSDQGFGEASEFGSHDAVIWICISEFSDNWLMILI